MKLNILFTAVLISAMFESADILGKEVPAEQDILGGRFICFRKKYENPCIHLSVLKSKCELKLSPGESIPAELTAEVILITMGEKRVIKRPNDLANCVDITSAEKSIEFLRFFSSYETVYLFDEQILEVFPASESKVCQFVCVNNVIWKKLDLTPAKAIPLGNGFQITRYVIKPFPESWKVSLYRRIEHVEYNGNVDSVLDQKVETSVQDLAGLSFPMFL